jgi:hypothetical protein
MRDRRHLKQRYAIGKRVTAEQLRALRIERGAFHGDWNYTIHSRRQHE